MKIDKPRGEIIRIKNPLLIIRRGFVIKHDLRLYYSAFLTFAFNSFSSVCITRSRIFEGIIK